MAKKTLREFSTPSTENIHTGPTLKTNNLEFEHKPSLINMVQATLFSGKAHEDASAHLQNFLEISSIVIIKDVVGIYKCKQNMKDSASAQNTIVAFYQEYSRYRYLYFTIGKQWSKDY